MADTATPATPAVRTPLAVCHYAAQELWAVVDADGNILAAFPYGLSRSPELASQLACWLVAGSQGKKASKKKQAAADLTPQQGS